MAGLGNFDSGNLNGSTVLRRDDESGVEPRAKDDRDRASHGDSSLACSHHHYATDAAQIIGATGSAKDMALAQERPPDSSRGVSRVQRGPEHAAQGRANG
jgi:hypothetical protein